MEQTFSLHNQMNPENSHVSSGATSSYSDPMSDPIPQEPQEEGLEPFETATIGFLNILFWFIVLIFLVALGYYQFRYFSVKSDIEDIDAKIAEQEQTLQQMESQKVNNIFIAQKALKFLEQETVSFSTALQDFEKLTSGNLWFSAIRGESGGNLFVTSYSPSFSQASKAIRALNDDPRFHNVFVPSLTKGVTGSGQALVSFTLNTEYQSNQRKVPRK